MIKQNRTEAGKKKKKKPQSLGTASQYKSRGFNAMALRRLNNGEALRAIVLLWCKWWTVHENLQKESVRTRYRSISIICLALRVINVIAFVLNLGVLEWTTCVFFPY